MDLKTKKFKVVNNRKEDFNFKEHEECAICYEVLNTENAVKLESNYYCFLNNDKNLSNDSTVILNCGHKFHYNCIYSTFLTNKIKANSYELNYNINRSIRVCPYCREKSDYLPILDGQLPSKMIHKEFHNIEILINKNDYESICELNKKYNFLNKHKCLGITSSGCQCKKNKVNDHDFCYIHSKKYSNTKIN